MEEKYRKLKELIQPLVVITCEHCLYVREGRCGKVGDCNIKEIRKVIEDDGIGIEEMS